MLSAKGLAVFYGESQILTDVTVEVPSGKVVCLTGRNGVGKTTLLKAIMGVLKPRRGSVIFDNQDMTYFASHFSARLSSWDRRSGWQRENGAGGLPEQTAVAQI